MKNFRYCVLLIAFIVSTCIHAQDIHISLAKLPVVAESRDKGVFVDMVKAISKEYQGGKVTYNLYPFTRSLRNVADGEADIHIPFIRSEKAAQVLKEMGLEYALERSNRAPFALYYHTDNEGIKTWINQGFDPAQLSQFTVYTEQQHTIFFDKHELVGKPCLPCIVKMVSANRIDGVIFAGWEIDAIIKEKKLSGIESVLFHNFDASPVFRADANGHELNKKVSAIIAKLRESGQLGNIMKSYTDYYQERFGISAL